MIEHGIIVNGSVLPNTESVIRDSDAWWDLGIGTRSRQGSVVDRIVGHWTAGPCRTGPAAGRKVVAAMRARVGKEGRPLDVGIHFVIAWDGGIWQTCDLGTATVHVGDRRINRLSIGVECCWPGTTNQAARLGIDGLAVEGYARGRSVWCLRPRADLLTSWRWLVHAICDAQHPAIRVPHKRGSMIAAGVMEHCDVAGTTKVDAAGLLVAEALR